ncbi:MAG TPA: permease-like cell division protein FtsX [Pseudomonadales bacterium]|nr:permease-like cell division protein FtsX [Pseudomonadales bacterium]
MARAEPRRPRSSEPTSAGASAAAASGQAGTRITKAPRLLVWGAHHRLALAGTLARLREDWLGTAMVALTLGIALALPALLWVVVGHLSGLAADWDDRPRINVFVSAQMPAADVDDLLARLRANPEVAEVSWQTPADSLAEFVRASGFGDTLGASMEALGGNPLPGVALATPVDAVRAPARLRALAARLESETGVDGVQLDLDWVLRMQTTLQVIGRLGWGLGLLLAAGVLLVVGSLTRMALEQRREEIIVLRLVGGTDAFVRRPFLYLGTLQGLTGGLAAWLLVMVAVVAVGAPVAELARSYGSAFRLDVPVVASALLLVGAGAGLGWLGARIAVGRSLAAIEP